MSPLPLTFDTGVIYNESSTRMSAITDGTSDTMAFGEHSKGHLLILDPNYGLSDDAWNSG